MRFGKPLLLRIAIGLLALLVALPIVLSLISWNFAKPWIAERVEAATGRSLVIDGDLDLSWQRPAHASGWRRLVPWLHWRAEEVQFGNPDWATTGPTMLAVPQVDFTLHPFKLLTKTISIGSLVLTEPDLALEIGPNGDNNWSFREEDEPSAWRFVLHDLSLNRGTIRLVDATRKADVTTRIDTLDDGSVTWNIRGRLDRDKVAGSGKAGALLSLKDADQRYPVSASLNIGDTDIRAEGTLTDPRRLSALDIKLNIQGASMAQLFPFSGIVLPDTPRFSTAGRLVGSLKREDFHLRYIDFTGRAGSSDIRGTLEYVRRDRRPLLRGEVVSDRLNLKDLGALVGGGDAKQRPDKVLPVAPFRTERWDKLDAEVTFTGKQIIRREGLPLDNLSATIGLDNGTLNLAPLNFGVAGGRFVSSLRIEGKAEPPRARLEISARQLKLARLFPKVESMRASLGEVNGNAKLTATGESLAALAASANGEVKTFVSEGQVSKLILEAMGLNIGSVIVTQLFGDRQVQLNCLAGDFAVQDGVMQTRTFVVDTEEAIISAEGKIDLESESMDVTIRPESKGLRLFSLRAPLYVQGTFKNPDVGVDKGVVGAKAGAAVALGTLATPLAALLALVNPGPEEDSPCPGLLAQAKEKPKAPPPGKSAR